MKPLTGLLLCCLATACSTGVDTNREDPEPAVGRTYGVDDHQADTARDYSHPERNISSDTTRMHPGRRDSTNVQ